MGYRVEQAHYFLCKMAHVAQMAHMAQILTCGSGPMEISAEFASIVGFQGLRSAAAFRPGSVSAVGFIGQRVASEACP
jgi:hypothetical protein